MTPSSIFGTMCIRMLGTWAIVHGLLTILNGAARWASPVYDTVRLLPGSPYTWGVILVCAGILVLWASLKGIDLNLPLIGNDTYKSYRLVKNTGLWIIAIWCSLFAIGVATAAYFDPGVSLAIADRDILVCALSVMMTKAVEPRWISDQS